MERQVTFRRVVAVKVMRVQDSQVWVCHGGRVVSGCGESGPCKFGLVMVWRFVKARLLVAVK